MSVDGYYSSKEILMGQYKFYICVAVKLRFGVKWSAEESLEFDFLCFTFGIGLTETAKGFGFWADR